MVKTINTRKKIIDRIKKENIEYKESFNNSLINQYTYTVEKSYSIKNNKLEEKKYITAPKFTDDSILEQTYSLAHELGHYNLDNSKHFILKNSTRNIIIRNIVERKAWKEAIKICTEEAIPIGEEFYQLEDKCLKTYMNEMKRSINSIVSWVFYSIKAYYLILFCLYIAYKCTNDNILDLFGIFKCFKDIINAGSVYHTTNCIWILYVTTYLLVRMIKRISNKNEKEGCIYEDSK